MTEAPWEWLRRGRTALVTLELKAARESFARAAEGARARGTAQAALHGLVLTAQADNTPREAARAAAAATENEAPHPDDCVAVSLSYLEARQREAAKEWLLRALERDPSHLEAATRLLGLLAEDGDRLGIIRLQSASERHGVAQHPKWRVAAALAASALEPERLGESAQRALLSDPGAVEVAEAWLAEAAARRDDVGVDAALGAMGTAAVIRGEWLRAFLAAACRVARQTATSDERALYARGRVGLDFAPRGAFQPGWVREWLGSVWEGAPAPFLSGRSVVLPPELGQAASAVGIAFGLGPIEVLSTNEIGIVGERAVGLVNPGRLALRPFRFEMGRLAAALSEPSLGAGLLDPVAPAARILDRAGLVAARDPVVVLARVGPRSPRALALYPFILSRTLLDLWRRLGVG